MANIKYVFGNLRTGEVLEEISLFGVEPMTSVMNDWGLFGGTFQLDQSGKDNADLKNATVPGQSFVVCERDNNPIWGGIVWTRVYQSQSKTMQLSARSFEAYFERKKILTDFSSTAEQRNIFLSLIDSMQSNPETNLGLTVPSSFPTVVTKTVTILGSERKNYLEVFASLANGDDGFDWKIDIVKTSSGNYNRVLRVGYPQLGVVDATALQFEYPGTITNYFETASLSEGGTNVAVLGQGEGSSMLVSNFVHQDLLDSGQWLRWDLDISKKSVTDLTALNSLALKMGPQRRPPVGIQKVFVRASADPVFGSYGLGDTCTVVIKDANHPDPGVQLATRIVAIAYKPPSSDAVEEAELIFQGDELNA